MPNALLIVDKNTESFGRVWVHVQDPNLRFTSVEYRARIATAYVESVFDAPDKEAGDSWERYLREETRELGSAMLEAYFKKMAAISGAKQEPYRWVIATLDAVVEDDNGLELQGRAVPFDSNKYLS
jgi:hypothetical protein